MLRGEYETQARQRQQLRRERQRDTHRSHSRSWATSWSAFDRDNDDEVDKRQLEHDRRTFLLYFRPKYDFRQLIAKDIDAITSFLRDHLDVAHWDLPADNAGIERVLKQAVADGKLVPVVNRESWRTSSRTFRPSPVPLRWPLSVNTRPVMQAAPYGGGVSAKFSTTPALASVDAVAGNAGVDGGGLDWLGVAEAAAGAVFGSDDASDATDVASADDSAVADDTDTSTPLGNAQPFELDDHASSGDTMHIAARGLSEAAEAECHAQYEMDMELCNVKSAMLGGSPAAFSECAKQAFSNYQTCRGY